MPLGHIARSGTLRDASVSHRDALGKIYRVGGILRFNLIGDQ
jgi:hypothetical protein